MEDDRASAPKRQARANRQTDREKKEDERRGKGLTRNCHSGGKERKGNRQTSQDGAEATQENVVGGGGKRTSQSCVASHLLKKAKGRKEGRKGRKEGSKMEERSAHSHRQTKEGTEHEKWN
mmetsp:Transcript_3741/g.7704  ORF Transcript_3741/g.7704 Transcript_3741/m.7704 type:complete len:121 (-) Transcript_3741:114-476(-)